MNYAQFCIQSTLTYYLRRLNFKKHFLICETYSKEGAVIDCYDRREHNESLYYPSQWKSYYIQFDGHTIDRQVTETGISCRN